MFGVVVVIVGVMVMMDIFDGFVLDVCWMVDVFGVMFVFDGFVFGLDVDWVLVGGEDYVLFVMFLEGVLFFGFCVIGVV